MTGTWIRLTRVLTSFKYALMPSAAGAYQNHLDRVSRSFAFCIRQLPPPLKDWVGLSYLLCRLLDTIEDAAWEDAADQDRAFKTFDRALRDPKVGEELARWSATFPATLVEAERLLIDDAAQFFSDLHALPPPVRKILVDVIALMSAGMQHFCREKGGGAMRLKSLAEVNQYCFFVAGVVGELLAKVLARVEPRFSLSQPTMLRAYHFGLFLQKVNILKDQRSDESLGRHLVPSRETVAASSAENAREALLFLTDIPAEQIEFRRFCAWSLFLGLESLRVFRQSSAPKVARPAAENLFREIEERLEDKAKLETLFANYATDLEWPARDTEPAPGNRELPGWFTKLYSGELEAAQLRQLGIVS